jgi:hypothetical protein
VVGAFAWFGSAAEAASCGHYVKRLGPGFVPGKAAAEQVAAEEAAHQSSPAPCGCQGPECHRAPADTTPLVPGSPLRIPAPKDITSLATSDFVICLSGNWRADELSCRPLSGHPARLNRPPALAL